MSKSKESHLPKPPYNPGLRDLVENRRRFSAPSNPEAATRSFRGWNERGYLPHRDDPGLTQFVTFRLADSFPDSLRSEWEHLWHVEDVRRRRIELENYLDRGRGECHLRKPELATLMEEALRFFHTQRYELLAWCVMPNHVHVLFKVETFSMGNIVQSWKKFTAQKANRLLHRRGSFWQKDFWDTYMRDAEHERKSIRYIENNPAKAKLILDPKSWPWSSARFRDDSGKLML